MKLKLKLLNLRHAGLKSSLSHELARKLHADDLGAEVVSDDFWACAPIHQFVME